MNAAAAAASAMSSGRRNWLGLAGLVVLIIIAPFVLDPFWLRIATGVLMWVGLAVSWNIIGGYTGYVSFGHGAFFGVGAYTVAILMSRYGVSFPLALLVGGVLGTLASAVVGPATLRLQGAYFAIATWALAKAFEQMANVLNITGGPYGTSLPPLISDHFFYAVMGVLTVFTAIATFVLAERSRFGLQIKAIRENEDSAAALGIHTMRTKIMAFAISAFFPALFGGVYAYWVTFINPQSVLGDPITDQMIIMALLGGLGTFWGPFLGGALLYVLKEVLWIYWSNSTAYLAVMGLVICLIVVFRPDGLISFFRRPGARRPAQPSGGQ